MGLRIQNNIAAMNAHRQLSISDSGLSKSLERLSSGYRINRASDDAAGLAISQQFRADIASFKVASRNTAEASSLLQVAEGAMDQIGNMLTRLKELATQAASANAGSNLNKLEAEKANLILEIDRIANSTKYAGSKLLDGTFGETSATWKSTGITGVAGSSKILEANTGRTYTFLDDTADTPNLSFNFSDTPALTAQVYTINTITGAAGDYGVRMTGANAETFFGTISGTTLSFNTIGLTIVGATTLTTTLMEADTFEVLDTGFTSMSVDSTTSTGTWTITDTGNVVTLSNASDSKSQAVTSVNDAAQTLDFDQLGIKLTLGSAYTTTDLATLTFVVASEGSSTFQVGAENTVNDRISISIGKVTTASDGLNLATLNLTTSAGAQTALDRVNTAISSLGNLRGDIGASMNRLAYAAANLSTTIENVQAAESMIRDVDMASEMTAFTKNQILLQAGTAMLAQANMAPQNILSLFGG